VSRQLDEVELAGKSTKSEGVHETERPVEGETLEDSERFPVNRLRLVRATVDAAESPTFRVIEPGEAMLKSTTITVTVVVWCDNESLVPVTVTR